MQIVLVRHGATDWNLEHRCQGSSDRDLSAIGVHQAEELAAQLGAENVTIDLGSTRAVDGVTLTLGSHPLDFPRTLVIESSEDGVAWTSRWQGSPAAVAFTAAVRHPKEMPLYFELPKVAARMLRLRQVGHDPNFHWLIFELAVHGR